MTATPALVPAGSAIVAAGLAHSAALDHDGTVLTWGWNPYGALGDGTTTTRARPTAVAGVRGVAVASGALHTLIVG